VVLDLCNLDCIVTISGTKHLSSVIKTAKDKVHMHSVKKYKVKGLTTTEIIYSGVRKDYI